MENEDETEKSENSKSWLCSGTKKKNLCLKMFSCFGIVLGKAAC